MIDPNLIIGATLFVIGYGAGRIHLSTKSKQNRVEAICTCTHSLAHHDKKTDRCFGKILNKNTRTKSGAWIGDQWVDCTCRQYVGPQPIENFFATPAIFNDENK